jgi:microcystin degradation protein MlrC
MVGETILVAEFSQETNTFATEPTDRTHSQERREYVAEEIPTELRDTNSTIGGFIEVADADELDGLALSLHGAMVSENHDDGDYPDWE